MLKVENLRVSYGHIEVLKGISFTVEMGEIVALIGGNGAGKTTTLSTVSGLLRPTSGTLGWKSEAIHPTVIEQVFDKILELNQRTGLGVRLVEQNSAMALELAARAFVLETGTITLSGPSATLADDRRVREAYLGG